MTTRTKGLLVVAAVLLAACGREPEGEAGEGTEGMRDTTGMPGMQGMSGMQGMPGMQMMNDMMGHMRQMEGLSADSMRAMMPRHRQLADSAMSGMERQMRSMDMPPDTWSALADSLRQDMARMSEMSAAELEAAMPAHHARMQRLMEMHRGMTPPAPQ